MSYNEILLMNEMRRIRIFISVNRIKTLNNIINIFVANKRAKEYKLFSAIIAFINHYSIELLYRIKEHKNPNDTQLLITLSDNLDFLSGSKYNSSLIRQIDSLNNYDSPNKTKLTVYFVDILNAYLQLVSIIINSEAFDMDRDIVYFANIELKDLTFPSNEEIDINKTYEDSRVKLKDAIDQMTVLFSLTDIR